MYIASAFELLNFLFSYCIYSIKQFIFFLFYDIKRYSYRCPLMSPQLCPSRFSWRSAHLLQKLRESGSPFAAKNATRYGMASRIFSTDSVTASTRFSRRLRKINTTTIAGTAIRRPAAVV